MSKRLASVFVALLLTVPAMAQYWPQPSKVQGQQTVCPAGSSCEGKSLAAYTSPLTYVGTYEDSAQRAEYQCPERTLHAFTVRVTPDHSNVYMIVGGGRFAAYNYQRFFARLAASEPLMPVMGFGGGGGCSYANRGAFPEGVLAPDWSFSAEKSSWSLVGSKTDGQQRLYGFDFDDRGYVYVAYDPFGWGVIRDGFSVYQNIPSDIAAFSIVSMRVGNSYYAIVSPQNGSSLIYDVTDPANPRRAGTLPFAISHFAKLGDKVAAVAGGRLVILSGAAQVSTTIDASQGAFFSVAPDGDLIYALSLFAGRPIVTTLDANLTRHDIDVGLKYNTPPGISAGGGYVALFGQEWLDASHVAPNLRLYRSTVSGLVAVPTLTPKGEQYFAAGYAANYGAQLGYGSPNAGPDPGPASLGDVAISYPYMLGAFTNLGVVYSIAGGTPPPPPPPPNPCPHGAPDPGCVWVIDPSGDCAKDHQTCTPAPPPGSTADLARARADLVSAQSALSTAQAALSDAAAALTGSGVQPPPVPPQPVQCTHPTPGPGCTLIVDPSGDCAKDQTKCPIQPPPPPDPTPKPTCPCAPLDINCRRQHPECFQ